MKEKYFSMKNRMLTEPQFLYLMNHPDLGKKRRIKVPYAKMISSKKIVRCNTCESCLVKCVSAQSACLNCKDRRRLGGFNVRKQACQLRPNCLRPVLNQWIEPKSRIISFQWCGDVQAWMLFATRTSKRLSSYGLRASVSLGTPTGIQGTSIRETAKH